MVNKLTKMVWLFMLSSLVMPCVAMVYDNRHFPLLDKPILRRDEYCFFMRLQPFFMTGDKSWPASSDGNDVGLFDITGMYKQQTLDTALQDLGITDQPLIPPHLEPLNLLWRLNGKLEAGGLAMRWFYTLSPNWEIGGSGLLMGARTSFNPLLLDEALRLESGDIRDVFEANDQAFSLDSIERLLWSNTGLGDFDLYLRLGVLRHYYLKFKTFDMGIKVGMIAPVASRREITIPGSLPFGGNGHWGIYGDFALDTELREDFFAGFNMRLIKRFARDQELRIPVAGEPQLLGALITEGRVDPGLTYVFSPYVALTGIRDGWGAQMSYSLIMHWEDTFTNLRPFGQRPPIDFQALQNLSEWNSEYLSFSLLYDFAYNKECRDWYTPMIYLDVDIPLPFRIVGSKNSNKTYGVSLRIETGW